jgi:hypothetical protein
METLIGILLIVGLIAFLLRPTKHPRAWTNEEVAAHNQVMANVRSGSCMLITRKSKND